MSAKPTTSARTAVAAENHNQNHSADPSSKSWKPPSDAKCMRTRTPLYGC